jgi:predicted small secreted protein
MRAISTIFLAMAAMSLTACNTVKGAGKDIVSVGQAGQDAIKSAKKN